MVDGDLTELLHAHRLRITPQRLAILEAFRGRHDEHLSAEEVISRASVAVPNIGRGTVYATLAELSELGLLAAVGSSDPIRYETNLAPHDHFRCRVCMRLFDVDLGAARLPRDHVDGFTIETIAAQAEGVCAECHAYQRGLSDGAARCLSTETLPAGDLGTISCARVDSPLGELALAASSEGIVHLAFSDHADFTGLLARARSRRGSAAARARLAALDSGLEQYFAGGREPFHHLIDWRLLDEQQRRALLSVQQVPFAGRLSYERVESGLTAYDRGHLMGSNPIPLLAPCHRISRGATRPEVYVGGTERLHLLQALESD
jgi:Fe2+ or Zn2+ uptake regulation protein/O6-methylguanine-DNA--protein-cysteine methyltransferase